MVFGRVYSIRSNQTKDIYIGSTTQPLSKRMVNHRTSYKVYLDKKQHYITSFEIIKHGDAYIELVFEGEFESKDELRKKEGEYQREMNCVNKKIEGRTRKEYYDENKESLSEKHHEYYEKNKESLLEKQHIYNEANKELISEKNRNYRDTNKELISKNKRDYRKANIESILKQKHAYYEANKESILEQKRSYYEANKESFSAKNRNYYDANKGKLNTNINCACGVCFTHQHKSKHFKTKKHQLFLKNQNLNVVI